MKVDPTIELLLSEATHDKMYGSLEFKFEAGKLVLAKKTETIKPTNYRDSRDDGDGQSNAPHDIRRN